MDKGKRRMTPEEERDFFSAFNSLGVIAPPIEEEE